MIKGLVENGELDLQAKESQLLWEDTSIYTFQDEDEVVTVTPVSSPEFDSWNLVTIIDANGEIESYEETQLRHLANDDVKITKWANGVPKGERVYNPNAPQIQRGLGEVYKRLNDCWGAHGVLGSIGTLAVTACLSQSWNIPVALACIAGLGLVGGPVGWCVGYAVRGTGNEYA